jgi:uroporphyrinogen-III synthase
MTNSSLSHVTFWLTRPSGVHGDMAQRLEQLGARVMSVPALEIRALPADHPAMRAAVARLEHLQQYRHIIFISGNAVVHGMALIEGYLQQWPQNSRCYAMGKTTAKMLAAHGIEALQPRGPQMNSEALVALPELQSVAGEKVLIVRGVGGREWLCQALVSRGAEVDYLETYQRLKSGTLPPEISRQLAAGTIDFLLAASGETVTIIVELVEAGLHGALMDIAIVVPGQRVADIARQAGFKWVIMAANAGDDAMIEAILGAMQQQG